VTEVTSPELFVAITRARPEAAVTVSQALADDGQFPLPGVGEW
jgi:hypothetical protein